MNREGAKFCAQCATQLPIACASCGSELGAGARFCDQCGTPVGAVSETIDTAARKVVTILFADLVGSTSFGEQVDAESAREAMAGYHAMAQESIEAAGGTVAKFIGDGVMALFGVPETAEDDAERAVAAGLALQRGFGPIRDRIEGRHGAELGLRVGINTGEIVLADGDADLVGDAINTAARLEAACPPGEVLVGEETWRLTRSHVSYEVLGQVEVKGKHEPVATYRVIDDEVGDDDQATPFVGRTDELARLRVVFDEATTHGVARLVTVIGAPGVGKTRISREFHESLGDAVTVAVLRCERAGTATFAPIADLLRGITTIDDESDPAQVTAALRELVAELDDADRVADLLASFVGAAPARSTEEAFLAVRRLVEAVGRRQPLVVVVDDIQWAEPLFLDLLEHLAEWVREAPAVLVGLARPELRDIRPALAEPSRWLAATIALEGLDAAATAELAARLVGADSLPTELVARLPDSTEGNPLFVRELMRMLVDDGVIEQTTNGWQLTIDANAVEVPPTIQSLLSARLDRMPADERRLVELASVVGPEFALGAVGSIADGIDGVELRRSLEHLRRRELIESTGTYWGDEPIYRFHHVLIRDAAYRRLLKRARADLHLRVGEWTERTAAELPGEHEAAIAYHYEQAHEYRRQLDDVDEQIAGVGRRAAELLGTAANRSLERDDLAAAGALAERSLARLDEGDSHTPPLLVVAAEASLALGDVSRGRPLVERLSEVAGDDARLGPWAECFVAQLLMLTEPDRLQEAEQEADRAATRLAELGDEAGVAKARLVRAGALARLGQVGRSEAELDLALTAARSAGDRRRVAAVLGAAPIAALWGPSPIPRAGGRCLDVIRLLRITTGSPAVEATSVRCQAVLEALRGRFDTARSMLADSRATVEELGLRHGVAETDLYTGIVELLAGEPAVAEPPLRAAYHGLGRLGIGADAGQAAAYLARALLLQGHLVEAAELADRSAELAGENPQTAITARTVQAEILASRGHLSEAVAAATEAVARAEGTDIIVDHANASAVLARVARQAGDAATAERSARSAAALYEQKAATIRVETEVSTVAAGAVPDAAAGSERRAPEDGPWNKADERARRVMELFVDRSSDAWLEMVDPDVVAHHRQALVNTTLRGRDEYRQRFPRDIGDAEFEAGIEPVAVRGDDLALHRLDLRLSDGQAEWHQLRLTRWNTSGRIDLASVYEPDDLAAAMDELDRLYQEELRDSSPAEDGPWNEADRLARRFVELFTAGARDEWLQMLSPDQVTSDRRPLVGVDTAGVDGVADAWPRDRETRELTSTVEPVAVRGESFALVRWRAVSTSGREWDSYHLTRWTPDGLNDLNIIFPPDQLGEAVDELDRLHREQIRGSVEAGGSARVVAEHEPWNEADRLSRLMFGHMADRDVAVFEAMLADEVVVHERQPHIQALHVGRAAVVAAYAPGLFPADVDLVADVETVATRGEHLVLTVLKMGVVGDGSSAMIEVLVVDRWNHHGFNDYSASFSIGQLAEAVEQLERLYLEEIGDSIEGWHAREFGRAMALLGAGEVDAFIDLHDPSFVMRDHRQLGWADVGLDEYRERMNSIVEVAADARVFQERVLRLDHTSSTCAAQRIVFTTPEGSQQISRSVMVMMMDPYTGLITLMEQFEEDRVDEAVARFDELMAERGPVLHNEASQRASFINGWLQRGDDDLVAGEVSADATFIDEHGEPFELTTAKRREVMAVRGERLALVQLSGPGHSFAVEEIDGDGKLSAVRRYGSDRLREAMVVLDRRWLEIGGDEMPPVVRLVTEYTLCFNQRDATRLAEVLHDEHELVDHREFGWPALGRDDVLAMVDDHDGDAGVLVVSERLAASADASLAHVALWVTEPDGASTQGFVAFTVVHVVGGRVRSNSFFGDVDTARVHLDQLSGRAAVPGAHEPWNEADRLARLQIERFFDPSLGSWEEFLTPDYFGEDRRPVVGHHIADRDEVVAMWSGPQVGADFTVDVETIATRGEHFVLFELIVQNGEFETRFMEIQRWSNLGFLEFSVRFDLDQEGEAMNELDRLWPTSLNERRQAVSRLAVALGRAWVAPSTHTFDDLLTGDFEFVDGRTLGMGSLDRVGFEEALGGREADGATGVPVPSRVEFVSGDVLVFRANNLGHAQESGVDWEEIACNVLVVDGDRIARLEMFDEDHWFEAIARAEVIAAEMAVVDLRTAGPDELAADPRSASGARVANAASRSLDESIARLNAGESADELIADDFRRDDRRGHLPFPDHGADELKRLLETNSRLGAQHSIDHIAVRGERLVLSELSTDFEERESVVEMLVLAEFDATGRLLVETNFEIDRLAEALAEIDDRWLLTLEPADAETYRVAIRQYEAYVDLDGDRFEQLTGEGLVFVDHRRLGNFGELDRTGFRELFEARRDTLGPGFARVTAVYHLADGVVVWSKEEHTRSDRYDAQSTSSGIHVIRVVAGRVVRGEVYDDVDLEAAVARAEELIAEGPPAPRLDNMVTRWADRAVSLGGLGDKEMFSDDFVREDRQSGVAADPAGRLGLIESLRVQREMGATYTWDWIAIRDARFALGNLDVSYGDNDIGFLSVMETDDEGRALRMVHFDPDDLAGAYDGLDELWLASLDPDDAQTYQVAAAQYVAYVGLDRERLDQLSADVLTFVDHRSLGNFGELDRAGFFKIFDTRGETRGPGVALSIAVHRLGDGMVVRSTEERTSSGGSGGDTFSSGVFVQCIADGQVTRVEIWDADQVNAALGRAEELMAGSRSGLLLENVASRWSDRAVGEDGRLADLSGLIADAFVREDRRTTLSDDHANPARFLESLQVQRQLGARYSPELLAIRGERFALHRMTIRYGTSVVEFLTVLEVDADGLAVHSVQFDSEDVQGAMDHLSRLWAATLSADVVSLLRLAAAYERAAYADGGDNEVFADDVAFVDHRPVGFGEVGLDEWRRFQGQRANEGSRAGVAPEVVPVTTRVLLFSNIITIEAGDDTAWEEFYFQLLVTRDGKVARLEVFGEDQRERAFERALELADSSPSGLLNLD